MTREIDGDVIARIVRAFDAAFMRFAKAETFDEQEDEASNLLHHLYRLASSVYGSGEDGGASWTRLRSVPGRQLIPALVQMRHVDVHGFVRIADIGDRHSDIATNLVGTLEWNIPTTSPTRKGANGLRDNRPSAVLTGAHIMVLDSLVAAKQMCIDDFAAHGKQ